MHHPHPLPSSRRFPDPQHFAGLERLEALQMENRAHALRELTWYTDEDGMWVLKGRLSAEQGALISKVLEGVMEELDEEQKDEPADVSAETPEGVDLCEAQPYPVAVRRADALERVAESYLAGGTGDRSGGGLGPAAHIPRGQRRSPGG